LGCAEILKEVDFEPDHVYAASGTGTTAAGLLLSAKKTKIVAVPVLKKGDFIKDEVINLLKQFQLNQQDLNDKIKQFSMNLNSHFGGYGKFNSELITFINDFYFETKIKLDQIYTAKMMYAILGDIMNGKIEKNSTVLALHTGGLQGLSSIKNELDFKL